ncbi:hypothetical protein BAE44_0012581, partial [Dichanthelium oligosanthes]
LHRGSVLGRRPILRNIYQGHDRIFVHYFAKNPVYNDNFFRRRYVLPICFQFLLILHPSLLTHTLHCLSGLG